MAEILRRTLGEHIRIETVLSGGLWAALRMQASLKCHRQPRCYARDAMPDAQTYDRNRNAELDDRYARVMRT